MVIIDGSAFPITVGQGVFVRQGSVHGYHVGNEGMNTLEVKFSTDDTAYREIMDRIPRVFSLTGQQLPKLFDRIIDERFVRQSGYQILACSLLGEALVYLDRSNSIEHTGISLDKVLFNPSAPMPIKAINEFVSRHIDQKFSLSELASGTGYNQDYLYRVVAREFGMSLVQYVNSLRLESAKQYLLNSELSMTDIAWNLGFDTIQSFSKFFSHNAGESPSRFLKRIQQQHHDDHL